MSVFLDSYAIVEMARGNPRYAAVLEEEFATSVGNLLEVYYVLLQSGEEDLAEKALDEFGPLAVDLPRDLLSRIARFRLEGKGAAGRRFSYLDASGSTFTPRTEGSSSSQGPLNSKGSLAWEQGRSHPAVWIPRHSTPRETRSRRRELGLAHGSQDFDRW